MALIQCPECGKMISDKAQMCIGCGCPISYVKKAIKRKNPTSVTSTQEMIEIADEYYWGRNGVDGDTEKAFQWYQMAAEKGDAYAQYLLGNCYFDGEGCDCDDEKAVYNYEKAAKQGLKEACRVLAECYEEGYGIDIDLEAALKWYRVAAEENEEDKDVLRLEHIVREERNKEKDDLIEFIENDYISHDEALSSLGKCIPKYSRIILHLEEFKGQAYFNLASHLHAVDRWIRFDYCGFEPPIQQNWHGYDEEIAALSELIAIKTNNVNLIIEKLLHMAYRHGYLEARDCLIDTYLEVNPYDDYEEFSWFDLMSMGEEYNSITEFADSEHKISDEMLKVYAKKALALLPPLENIEDELSDKHILVVYLKIADIFNDEDLRTRISVIKKKRAYEGDVECARNILLGEEAIIDLPEKVKEKAETGDKQAQELMADYYKSRYNKTNSDTDFENAIKWHEIAVHNNKGFTLLWLLQHYIDLLKSRDANLYQEKIKDLESWYSGVYDYCYRMI